MSKEQTPITAEVISILESDYGWRNLDQQKKKELFGHIMHDTISVCNDLINSKVLEALEYIDKSITPKKLFSERLGIEKPQYNQGYDTALKNVKILIETEVKPRYKD